MKTFFALFCSLFISLSTVLAADLSDGNAPPDLESAKALIDKKDWGSAITSLEKFVKANPNNADGFNLLGYSLRHNRRYPEAIFNYKEALYQKGSTLGVLPTSMSKDFESMTQRCPC
jgi:Flp pilus assembly protein TadD